MKPNAMLAFCPQCPAPRAGDIEADWRLTTILPDMALAEALETTRIHRVAGRTGRRTAFVTTRPFRAPTIRFRMWD